MRHMFLYVQTGHLKHRLNELQKETNYRKKMFPLKEICKYCFLIFFILLYLSCLVQQRNAFSTQVLNAIEV